MGSVCPGCGLETDGPGLPLDRPFNASPECWAAYAEVAGFELANMARLGRQHQLMVDAYGAQHPGGETGERRVVYSVVGLCLTLEHGWSGDQVRDMHQRMGPPRADWPRFSEGPVARAPMTVDDVAAAGARVGSVEGHEAAVARWAAAVWEAWRPRHDDARRLSETLMAAWPELGPRR